MMQKYICHKSTAQDALKAATTFPLLVDCILFPVIIILTWFYQDLWSSCTSEWQSDCKDHRVV